METVPNTTYYDEWQVSLSEHQAKVYGVLTLDWQTTAEISDSAGVSPKQAAGSLRGLRDRGLVEHRGSGRGVTGEWRF